MTTPYRKLVAHTYAPLGPVQHNEKLQSPCLSSALGGSCLCGLCEPGKVTSQHGVGPEAIIIGEQLAPAGADDIQFGTYSPTEIEQYCIQRLMVTNGCYDARNYIDASSGGRFGFIFENERKMLYEVGRMLSQPNDAAKVLYTLGLEYGYLGEDLRKCSRLQVETRRVADVLPPNNFTMLKRSTFYAYPIRNDEIIGVLYQGEVLVDGRQRVAYCVNHECLLAERRFIVLSAL